MSNASVIASRLSAIEAQDAVCALQREMVKALPEFATMAMQEQLKLASMLLLGKSYKDVVSASLQAQSGDYRELAAQHRTNVLRSLLLGLLNKELFDAQYQLLPDTQHFELVQGPSGRDDGPVQGANMRIEGTSTKPGASTQSGVFEATARFECNNDTLCLESQATYLLVALSLNGQLLRFCTFEIVRNSAGFAIEYAKPRPRG